MSKDVKNVPALRFKGYSDAWEKRKLREVSDVRDGTHASPKYYSQGYPLVTSKNLTSAGLDFSNISLISELDYKNINKRSRVDKGDILFGMIGTIGTPVMVHESNFAIKNVALIKEREAVLNSFLVQLLKSPAFINYIRNENVGGTQKFLSLNTIRNFRFSFPTSKEQAMVSRFLEKIDSLIAATQDKIDALEQAKRALLQRLFDQSWRFKGYSDPWEKRKLGETNSYFTDGNYGESYPKESELSDKENGVPFLRGSNLRNGELIEDNANYITKEKHAELTSGHLVEDDIVLAVRGSLGALGYVKEENIDWNINSQLAVIRTDKSELSGKFLAQFLLSWRGQKELLSRNTGTALKQLPIKQLKDVPVPIVNLDEQKEISALFTSIDNLIAATQSRLSSLELLKKALLQDLFI